MTSVLVRTVRALKGEAGVQEMLHEAASPRDTRFLESTDNWVSLAEADALLQAGITVTGDPRLPQRVGADAVRQHAGTQVATLLRSLGSPEAVLSGVTQAAAKFSTVSELEAVETAAGRAVVRAVARPGFTRSALLCDWTSGLLSTPCMLFGLPAAHVEQVTCQARGDSECRYVVTWDEQMAAATRDPEKRVTALEAQVVAMAQRLESAYATASDLVSADGLDTVLARIVERAANAVRAPGYLLAVRPEPDSELRVFSEGLTQEQSSQIALHAGAGGDSVGTTLCVEVASSRRRYGQLVAVHPSGSSFFPQEEQLLTLYAKHAAAVLDTAMALEESSRRHRHASGLLSLSQALAQAGTTHEVATRLGEAVTGVVDCDDASVWVWDEQGQALRREDDPHGSDSISSAAIAPQDTAHLERMLADPQPMFFGGEAEDPLLEAIMTDARLVAMAIVPIIARKLFLGLLAVGVRQRPDRLTRTPELLEQLSGVAALAATALQNGRLIDELGQQVIHDGLTGVLNRTGFGQSVARILARLEDAKGGLAGLLFVDLDHFKLLNDEHGHQFGDALLEQVADRLRATFRGEDCVARLGGDEFAVILATVHSEADLRVASARAREAISEPFEIDGVEVRLSASVGEALAPRHGRTIDDLVRQADQAMYREKSLGRVSVPSDA